MDRRKRQTDVAWVLIAAFSLAMLLPIATTPFQGDDIFNSYIDGAMRYAHIPFWQFFHDLNASWMRNGRFFPGALIESYGLFHIVHSLAVYKAFQIAITLLNVWTFYVLLRQFQFGRALSLLGVLILLCTFQLRLYHDGLLGFSGNIEFITEITFLATLGLQSFLRNGNRWLLLGSLAVYVVGLVTYEVTYLLWLVFLVVALAARPWRKALLLVLPYFVLSAGVILIQLITKAAAHVPAGADYSVSLGHRALLQAFLEQASAAIPLSYVAIDPAQIYAHGLSVFASVPVWASAGIFSLAAVGAWLVLAQVDRPEIEAARIRELVAIGVLLWFTPALLVAASARYQHELVFGLGHVPVYIEYFGVTMLLVALCAYAVRRWGVPTIPVKVAIALLLGCTASVLYASNSVVIAASVPDKEGFLNMEAGLRDGGLRGVSPESNLYVDGSIAPDRYLDGSAVDAKYYYFFKTGLRLRVHSIGSLALNCPTECRVSPTSYELLNVPVGEYAGYVALGHLRAAATAHGDVTSYASDVTLFARGVPSAAGLNVQYTEHGCGAPDRVVTRFLPPVASRTETIRLASACALIAMNTLELSTVSVASK